MIGFLIECVFNRDINRLSPLIGSLMVIGFFLSGRFNLEKWIDLSRGSTDGAPANLLPLRAPDGIWHSANSIWSSGRFSFKKSQVIVQLRLLHHALVPENCKAKARVAVTQSQAVEILRSRETIAMLRSEILKHVL